jgi:hypothetical protein
MLFKNSVRTSKRTPHFTITKINWLTLFKFNIVSTLAGCRSPWNNLAVSNGVFSSNGEGSFTRTKPVQPNVVSVTHIEIQSLRFRPCLADDHTA